MNIRLLRIHAVPIRISSTKLHVSGTCFFHESILWNDTYLLRIVYMNYMCEYKVDTYLLRILNIN